MSFTEEQIVDIRSYIYLEPVDDPEDDLTEGQIDFVAPLAAQAILDLQYDLSDYQQEDSFKRLSDPPTIDEMLNADIPNEILTDAGEATMDQIFNKIIENGPRAG